MKIAALAVALIVLGAFILLCRAAKNAPQCRCGREDCGGECL